MYKLIPIGLLLTLLTTLGIQQLFKTEQASTEQTSQTAVLDQEAPAQVLPTEQEAPDQSTPPATEVSVVIDYGPAGRRPVGRTVAWTPGLTALAALEEIAEVRFTQADPTHPKAVEAVDGIRTDVRQSRFWMFDVNDVHPDRMAQDFQLEAGDEVRWSYQVPPVTVRIDFGPVERAPLEVQVPFSPGMTALEAISAAAEVELTDTDPTHPKAVASIDGVGTDVEQGWFWLYDVNGRHPAFMPDRFRLKGGFEVRWYLTTPADRPADELEQQHGAELQASDPAESSEPLPVQVTQSGGMQGALGRLGE